MTTMTIAALAVAIATGTAAPALAQDTGPAENSREMHFRASPDGARGFMMRQRGRDRMGGGVLALVCSPQGADRLEHMLLAIEQRTDPTAEQAPLFDAFRTAALTAQTSFADSCAEIRPATAEAGAERDLVDRLQARLDTQQAHLAAMTSVLPVFEAFYDSLSDAQKQALEPRRERQRELRRLGEPDDLRRHDG
jgi:hypothetical protein